MLGVYGIARSLSDPIGALVVRLCSYVVFPVMAAKSGMERASLRMEVASTRMKLLLLAALGLSLFTAMADLPVKILYDERYQMLGVDAAAHEHWYLVFNYMQSQ